MRASYVSPSLSVLLTAMHTDRGKEESGDFEGCRFFVVGYCVEYGCFLSLTLISLLEGGNRGGIGIFRQ